MFDAPEKKYLLYKHEYETLRIEPWGPNAFRVRATQEPTLPPDDWALTEPVPEPEADHVSVKITNEGTTAASITNGTITASLSRLGKLTITNAAGKILLEEYSRNRMDVTDPKCSALRISAREFRGRLGSDSWHLTARFESEVTEQIFGMGQYQQPMLDLKGSDLELAQRNSQASIPFAVSSNGYGFLWNNPAVGRAVFGRNVTTFEALSTRALDYWVVAGDTPAEIVRAYGKVVGTPPEMPEYGLGFWQCKLRYQTQEEILGVAREHKRRGLPMDVIVVDYFHWPAEGDWRFDPTFWPDPDAMIQELKSLNIELMVSIWPTVDRKSENFAEMLSKGLLIRQDRGSSLAMEGETSTIHFDATHPEARKFIWEKVKKNYYDKGVKIFWLDEAEPEYTHYDFDNWRYHAGPNLMVGNLFPVRYSQAFYEGMKSAGQERVVNLVRCAWAGSQKYGALLWSGDIASSWSSLRSQVSAGLNAGMAGMAWWTTDIGGFHGGDPRDEGFRELFVRWFQWGVFCPVFRLHGDREPQQKRLGHTGGSHCLSGAPNEVWVYGEEVYGICKKYLELREKMRGYVRDVMNAAHVHGDPVIRPVFYEFPGDRKAWSMTQEYMFGSKYLVAPILEPGQRERSVLLPVGAQWRQFSAEGDAQGDILEGGMTVEVAAPLGYTPVFERQ
ncbi:glycosyl hydrolases family 31-domain-containing protein [Pseudomassariella vexata]|uniref:Glycosyl hydrolases family 31-domain-containing protein n=1 Tax=Pseudomassariella vexata TaxID=1141098 RepID=A0A1Y2DSC4_9PEZI|nr:glycosyl hydrolases family 31-domain-containing protein [Pseudomassariella vexata]ORY62054.1 glycosyl hydrolases family 31-domain-containing protein [Pseudomassariella vexata]